MMKGDKVMKTQKQIVCLSVLLMFIVVASYGYAIGPDVERHVLQGNWEGVFNILSGNDGEVKDPVARMIMGHACLATNKNNQSLLLFFSNTRGYKAMV